MHISAFVIGMQRITQTFATLSLTYPLPPTNPPTNPPDAQLEQLRNIRLKLYIQYLLASNMDTHKTL